MKDDQWRERIHDELARKMAKSSKIEAILGTQNGVFDGFRVSNDVQIPCLMWSQGQLWKLFSDRTPDYSGEAKHSFFSEESFGFGGVSGRLGVFTWAVLWGKTAVVALFFSSRNSNLQIARLLWLATPWAQ